MTQVHPKDGLSIMAFASATAWSNWLEKNHQTSKGVWIKFAKKASGIQSVDYDGALPPALCYGWIDGQVNRLDERYYLQRFTPRRVKSKWSKRNCGYALALIEQGLMQPAGLREVEAAQADGRWDAAYDSPSTATVPDDLQMALEAEPAALEKFATLEKGNRYSILYRIQDAKRPETRARRIATYVEMLTAGETPHA